MLRDLGHRQHGDVVGQHRRGDSLDDTSFTGATPCHSRAGVAPAASATGGTVADDERPDGRTAGRAADCSTARYRLGPVLARGGMSTVYRGTDTRLDRPVAIKVMDPRLAADPAFRARFEREARSAARIDHPAVVDVHDQGDRDRTARTTPVCSSSWSWSRAARCATSCAPAGALGVPAAFAVLEPVLAGLAAGPPARARAPRRQAGERADQPRRRGQGRRLRAGHGGRAGRRQPRRA